ncbi:hypothetical protein SDC9_197704 [bioreactor metagenome]|uniref:Uncharacterized protein n=1 Tax=bioreactor metagenome TaxID=1076179 RepID=A0A645IFJ6_9ZZZZ
MRYEQVRECDVPRKALIKIGADRYHNNLGGHDAPWGQTGVCSQQHVGCNAKIAGNYIERVAGLNNILKQLISPP